MIENGDRAGPSVLAVLLVAHQLGVLHEQPGVLAQLLVPQAGNHRHA